MHRRIGHRLDRDQFDAAGARQRCTVHRSLVRGQDGAGLGDLRPRIDDGVRGGSGSAGSHRRDQHPPPGGTGRLAAVHRRAREDVGVLGAGEPGTIRIALERADVLDHRSQIGDVGHHVVDRSAVHGGAG